MRPQTGLILLIVPLFLLACASSAPETERSRAAAPQADELQARLPVDAAVATGTLPNGLTYIIRSNKKPEQRVELRLVINAGSVLETDEQQGLAHFVEHMAFNGTDHFPKQELIHFLESIGMRFGPDINAYTSFDETVYMLQLPTDSAELLQKGFQVLADWARAVSFDDEEIDKERGVIIEEWRLGRGAGARMRDKQFPVLFHQSRYAERLPIGRKDVLESFQHETLREFYRTWYRPDLMAVIVVGDVEVAGARDLIERTFGSMQSRTGAPRRELYPVPGHPQTLYTVASDSEATSTNVSLYVKLPVGPQATVADYRTSLVEQLYSSMLNERLQELTKNPDPPFLFAYSGKGRFVRTSEVAILTAGVRNNGSERGLEALLTESARVRRHGFTATELERAGKSLLRSLEAAYQERHKRESNSFVSEYIRHFLNGEPIPGIEYEYAVAGRLLPGISLGEVNALARLWNTEENRVILVSSPEKGGITVPAESALASIVQSIAGREIAPYVDEAPLEPLLSELPAASPVVKMEEIPEIGVTEWHLANGVRVLLKPTDFKNDEVILSAFSPGGYSLVPDRDLMAARTAAGIVQESGLGAFSDTQLRKMLADKLVRVSPYISELTEGLSAQSSPKDLETLLQLVYLTFTSPRVDSAVYAASKTRLRTSLENRSVSPEQAFQDTLSVTMSQYHPRFAPWTVNHLEQMDLGASHRIYRERFRDAGNFTFLFVGAFDPASIRPLVERYLGGLPSVRSDESWADVTYEYPRGIITKEIFKGKEPKSLCSIVYSGPFAWSRENVYRAEAMIDLLRIKLRERLREDMGGTYGVGVRGLFPRIPRQRYQITVQFGCNPERVDELVREVSSLVDSLRTHGTTDDYLAKVKEIDLREFEVQVRQNRYWLGSLEFAAFHGLDPRLIPEFPKMAEALTLSDLRHAARELLGDENRVRVVLFPEGWIRKQE